MHVLMLLTKDVRRDPRVSKEMRTLEQAGIRVTLIFLDRECEHPPIERRGTASIHAVHIGRIHAGAPSSVAAALVRYSSRAVSLARKLHQETPFSLVHSHDLDTVPAGLLLSRQWKLPLIYDVHDLYSSYFSSRVMRSIMQRLDRVFYRCSDCVLIGHESFRCEIGDRAPSVILTNAPNSAGTGSVGDTTAGLFYAGNFDWLRDMRWAVPALMDSGIKVTFAGSGPLMKDYEKFTTRGAFELLGWISAESVESYTRTCFAVLALYDTRVPNNRLLVANKLLDAMKFGKPAIVSKNTTMAKIVRDFDCGVTVRYGDANSLRAAIEQLQDDAVYERMSGNAYAAFKQHFNWEMMEGRLLSTYRKLAGSQTFKPTSDVAASQSTDT